VVQVSDGLPRARRVGGTSRATIFILLGVVVVLIGVIAYLLVGSPLFRDEPQSDAERDYQVLLKASKEDPKNAAILISLAEAEYTLGKADDALAHAKKAVGLAEGQAGIRVRYATLLVREGDLDAAAKALQDEIKEFGRDSAEPYFLLAQIQVEQGKTDEGLKTMELALEISPMAADMRAVYADMLARAGKKKEAIAAYEEALTFLPGNADIISALEDLGVKVQETTSTPDPHGSGEGEAQ
jgi:tetratricopeptide (TPR) repeat protein